MTARVNIHLVLFTRFFMRTKYMSNMIAANTIDNPLDKYMLLKP